LKRGSGSREAGGAPAVLQTHFGCRRDEKTRSVGANM